MYLNNIRFFKQALYNINMAHHVANCNEFAIIGELSWVSQMRQQIKQLVFSYVQCRLYKKMKYNSDTTEIQ